MTTKRSDAASRWSPHGLLHHHPGLDSGRRRFLNMAGRSTASFIAAGLVPAWIPDGASDVPSLRRTVAAMGTTVTITAYGESRAHLVQATSAAFNELYRLDRRLSVFLATSDISRVNAAEVGQEVRVDASTLDVLATSGRFTHMTNGVFDASVGGLLSAWGFHSEAGTARGLPDTVLADIMDGIGWHHVQLDAGGSVRRLHQTTRIDLGGIGVGFTVDRMGEILRQQGVRSALIDHSGDLLAIGAPPESDGWSVAIPDPSMPDRPLVRMTLRDRAISTSSNVRTIRSVGGRSVGHIVEPQTGENPRHHASVSVLAPCSVEADALSTALFIDASPGGAWKDGQREAIFVRREGRAYAIESIT